MAISCSQLLQGMYIVHGIIKNLRKDSCIARLLQAVGRDEVRLEKIW